MKGILLTNYNCQSFVDYFNISSLGRHSIQAPSQSPLAKQILTISKNFNNLNFVFIWTGLEAISEEFNKAWMGEPYAEEELKQEIEAFAHAITNCEKISPGVKYIVMDWAAPKHFRNSYLLDLKKPYGRGYILRICNNFLYEALGDHPSVTLIESSSIKELEFSDKSYYLSKMPWTLSAVKAVSKILVEILDRRLAIPRKVLVVDLDNTLWGGVIGDLGISGIDLGGHSYKGEAFKAFQAELLALKNRGILLAIASKNTHDIALEAINSHSEMVLRENAFSALKINWEDKASNIRAISEDLNLGLQSFVFIDDSPIERGRVKESLPEVMVPEWPIDPAKYVEALHALPCFDVSSISIEDLNRSEQYRIEGMRHKAKLVSGSMDEWLKDLRLNIEIIPIQESIVRVAQLFNKTNQMNLSTRRLSELELLYWSQQEENQIFAVNVSDRFGDLGLTGISSFKRAGDQEVQLVDFILSCRAMGRGVEEFLADYFCEYFRKRGLKKMIATYLPTEKNAPTLDFLKRSKAKEISPNNFAWSLLDEVHLPSHIKLIEKI